MFEFSRFFPSDYEHGRDFVTDLEKFFGTLPKGWPYALEMRNKNWLAPRYFDCLSRHGITHVFNSWDAMPAVSEQMSLPGGWTNPQLLAARFLLKPGRKHEAAVKAFQPYDKTKEVNEEARKAGADLIQGGKGGRRKEEDADFRQQSVGGQCTRDHQCDDRGECYVITTVSGRRRSLPSTRKCEV